MYQVLLIDDELVALRTTQWILPWETLQVSRVVTATTADEAKSQLQKFQIDLVICDVEMPGTDGLTFARWIQNAYPDTAVIMLTCHQDFSFVQQSLRAGCLDYILKPVTAEVLSESVKRALENVEKRRRTDPGKEPREYAERLRQRQLCYELIKEVTQNTSLDVKAVSRELGLPFMESLQCRPVLVSIRRWLEQFEPEEDLLLRYGVYNAAQEELFDEEDGGVALRIDRDRILLVLYNDALSVDDVQHKCMQLILRCGTYLNCELSCCIGRLTDAEALGAAYREVWSASESHRPANGVYAVERSQGENNCQDWSGHLPKWQEMLSRQRYGELQDDIRDTLLCMGSDGPVEAGCLLALQQALLKMAEEYLQQHQLQLDALGTGEKNEPMQRPSGSVEQLMDWIGWLLRRIDAVMESIYREDELIQRITEFITIHINEDINRDSIASAVYLTPDYLSRIFKKRTGMGLTKYIVNRRIELACQLLTQTNMPIGSIAVELGYSSFSHFTKIFKQQVGKTPGAYRRDKGRHKERQ